jgi:hypothetical protein
MNSDDEHRASAAGAVPGPSRASHAGPPRDSADAACATNQAPRSEQAPGKTAWPGSDCNAAGTRALRWRAWSRSSWRSGVPRGAWATCGSWMRSFARCRLALACSPAQHSLQPARQQRLTAGPTAMCAEVDGQLRGAACGGLPVGAKDTSSRRSTPQFTQAKADNEVRWAVLNVALMLRRHASLQEELAAAMRRCVPPVVLHCEPGVLSSHRRPYAQAHLDCPSPGLQGGQRGRVHSID